MNDQTNLLDSQTLSQEDGAGGSRVAPTASQDRLSQENSTVESRLDPTTHPAPYLQTPPSAPLWVYFLIGLSVLTLIVSALFQLLTPQVAVVPIDSQIFTNFDQSTTKVSSLEITADFNPPTTLNAYQTENTFQTLKKLQEKLIEEYKLTKTSPNAWYSQDHYLLLDNQTQSLTFGIDGNREEGLRLSPKNLSKEERIQAASKYLNLLTDNSTLQLVESHISSFSEHEAFGESRFKEDDEYYLLPFAQFIDGYPLYSAQSNLFPFEVMVDSSGVIAKITIYPQLLNLKNKTTLPTFDLEKTKANLQNSQLSVARVDQEKVGPAHLENLQKVNLETFQIEYRYDPKTTQLLPFYRFGGTATNATGDDLTLEVLTPAVATVLVGS